MASSEYEEEGLQWTEGQEHSTGGTMASSEYEEEGLRLPVLKTDVQVQWTEGQEHCGVMVTTALTSHLFFLTSAQLAAFCSQGSLTAKKMKKVERKQELTVVKNDIVTP